jgi:hypothetical protein
MAKRGDAYLNVVVDPEHPTARVGEELARLFPADAARWLRAHRKLAGAGYGDAVVTAYAQYSPGCARLVGPDAAIALADTVSAVAIKANRRTAEALPAAALKAAEKLADERLFRSWLNLIQRFSVLAPESVAAVLGRTEYLLARLNTAQLEAWLLAGVRSAGSDPERRLRFFSMDDPDAERWLHREAGEVVFADVERRLKTYLTALWRLRVPIREPSPAAGEQARRRASFDRGLIRMPPTFPGYRGQQAEDVFRAALAHIAAHFMFSGSKFPVCSLKPIQIALVSIIEDARVEHLALREFPGLSRLWLPFHIAQATGARTAPSLLARLSRALIDPVFEDVDGWIRKGRDLFFGRMAEWDNPLISREIGGLLGNDLGQMRVQFNPRGYVVEPPYRDDNAGLWDFGDQRTPETEEAEVLFEAVRIERLEKDSEVPPDRERPEEETRPDAEVNRAAMSPEVAQAEGIPVARYPEFDYATGRDRAEWTTLVEYQPTPGPAVLVKDVLERRHDLVQRLSKLIRSARVSRPQRIKRQAEGDAIDLDACIEAQISRRIGEMPDAKVYARTERRHRDLSVLLLLDISESTKDKVSKSAYSVLDLEKEAVMLLAHAMAGLGDPFAIAAFCSNRRDDVRYFRIKDFDAPYNGIAQSYLAGLSGGLSTRIGAAMRHGGADLRQQLTHRRLLLVVTDGEPSDIDVSDRKYLVEDARKAVISLANDGIDVFCVGLDSGGDSYLSRIFGRRNVVQIDRVERLPEKLPLLYLRLTT